MSWSSERSPLKANIGAGNIDVLRSRSSSSPSRMAAPNRIPNSGSISIDNSFSAITSMARRCVSATIGTGAPDFRAASQSSSRRAAAPPRRRALDHGRQRRHLAATQQRLDHGVARLP